jgi:hypothetical protein
LARSFLEPNLPGAGAGTRLGRSLALPSAEITTRERTFARPCSLPISLRPSRPSVKFSLLSSETFLSRPVFLCPNNLWRRLTGSCLNIQHSALRGPVMYQCSIPRRCGNDARSELRGHDGAWPSKSLWMGMRLEKLRLFFGSGRAVFLLGSWYRLSH